MCNSGSDLGGCRIRSDDVRSLLNFMILMILARREVILEGMKEDISILRTLKDLHYLPIRGEST